MLSAKTTGNTEFQSLYEAFASAADKQPTRIALKGEGGRGRNYSYREVHDTVRSLAAGMQTERFAGCAEIALLAENRPEWPMAYLAITAAGRTVIPVDANLKPAEIAGIIKHSGVKAIFVSSRFETVLTELGLESEIDTIVLDEDHPRSYKTVMADASGFHPVADRDAIAALIYTSGTTGDPKAVVLTHNNLLCNLTSIRSDLEFISDDIFLSVLPLHHTFEATCGFLTPISTGCTIVYARSLKSRDILEDISHNNATIMVGVPLLYEKMYDGIQRNLRSASTLKRFMFRLLFAFSAAGWRFGLELGRPLFASLRNRAGFSTVRMFVSGGAALSPRICRFFNLLGLTLFQGYGMTECSPVITANRPGKINFESVGATLSGIEVKIHNPNQQGIGEVIVKGGNVTPGYKNSPEKTAELLRDGWLHTGDLGRLKDGELYITGRAKNLIVSGAGKNIYPEELEEKLMAAPLVGEVLVFGRQRDGKQGEEVRALIVPDSEYLESELNLTANETHRETIVQQLKQVVASVNNEVADYKRIVGFEMQFDELRKTSTKKVKRYLYE